MAIWLLAGQEHNTFHMHRRAELVYAAAPLDLIPCLQKGGQIPGKACWLAGNINDVLHTIGEYLRQCFWMDSVAGWIQYDYVRLFWRQGMRSRGAAA